MRIFHGTPRTLAAGAMPAGLALFIALLCGPPLAAQDERGSLTDQFPKMSAKERARIASQEVEESKKDVAYQDVMRSAEKAFQEGRYQDALAQYEQARAMRPYNVYPKVKIEDLRALLARQTTETATVESAPPPETVSEAAPPEPVHATVSEPAPPAPLPVVVPPPPPAEEKKVVRKAPEPPVVRAEEPVKEEPKPRTEPSAPPLNKADGLIERRYREGQAFVIERVVTVEGGRVVKYKRVFHQWGQVFYFEDGLAVDERVWKARFPER